MTERSALAIAWRGYPRTPHRESSAWCLRDARAEHELRGLAAEFDWPIIVDTCTKLVFGKLRTRHADEEIKYIQSLYKKWPKKTDHNYFALRETMRLTSYSELRERFDGVRHRQNP